VQDLRQAAGGVEPRAFFARNAWIRSRHPRKRSVRFVGKALGQLSRGKENPSFAELGGRRRALSSGLESYGIYKQVLRFEERWAPVRGAFATRPGSQVDSKRVLLVDDVLTTAAALDACARALLGVGRQVRSRSDGSPGCEKPPASPG
jgi:hypothetical protein